MVSIRQALQYVADNPEFDPEETLEMKTWEHIGHALFEIANSPNVNVRGSQKKASQAQRIILNRLVGTRRAGSHPVAREREGITFHDLTAGALDV